MTEIIELSREAREKLASALSILQSPEAGDLIDTVAGPVARAMGALHQIESTNGEKLAECAPTARDGVRKALGALQSAEPSDACDEAMAIIAGSLGLVHSLAKQATAQAAQPAPVAREAPAPKAKVSALDATQLSSDPPAKPRAAAPSGFESTQVSSGPKPAPAAPSGGLDQTLPTPVKPSTMSTPIALDSTQASVPPPSAEAHAQKAEPAKPAARQQAAAAPQDSKMASLPPDAMPEGAVQVEANLGAHSPTNFYKGLSGNDVVDDGGLFIATYDIPPHGTEVWVSVHMPGGYEFQGLAVVRWSREASAGDAPPGFGCTFKSVSKEARQLVYRYVKNREPLFHDDF